MAPSVLSPFVFAMDWAPRNDARQGRGGKERSRTTPDLLDGALLNVE
jgi:hypothetical protein